MENPTLSERALRRSDNPEPYRGFLGRPAAYLLTALVLLSVFGWTFVGNPQRVAPTRDPAFYTWRTEALLSEPPVRLIEIEGPVGMFESGYRVAAPLLGALLRQIPGVELLRVTVYLMVLIPVVIALLLGGFAYRQRRDPLAFHVVALTTGSLMLTPPFVGYLDNVLALLFLAAALHLLEPARRSWGARAMLVVLAVGAGLTHPTTLAIFSVVLALMAGARWVARRFDLRSTLRDELPVLASVFAGVMITLAIWQLGPWGRSASLGEAALPPPYGSDFFLDRMGGWIDAMNPLINAPLLLLGAALLLMLGRRAPEDGLARVGLLWLAPLVGLFGFLAGLTYPYYRFFNTTLAWVLLVGVGLYFFTAFLLRAAARTRRRAVAVLALVVVAAVVGANLRTGLAGSNWNDQRAGWISDETRRDMEALRSVIQSTERPVIFVMDDEPAQPFQIWAFTKLSGNTSRYGMPRGAIDQAYMYLGSLENYLAGEPTLRGEDTYDLLSPALLDDARSAVVSSEAPPIVVLASAFNQRGANAELASGERALPDPEGRQVVRVHEGRVFEHRSGTPVELAAAPVQEGSGPAAGVRRLLGSLLLLVPGFLAWRVLFPEGSLAEGLGLVPAFGLALLASAGLIVLAVTRSPLGPGAAIAIVVLATIPSLAGWVIGRRIRPRDVEARLSQGSA